MIKNRTKYISRILNIILIFVAFFIFAKTDCSQQNRITAQKYEYGPKVYGASSTFTYFHDDHNFFNPEVRRKIETGNITKTDLYQLLTRKPWKDINREKDDVIFLKKGKNNRLEIMAFLLKNQYEGDLSFDGFVGNVTWENTQTSRNICDLFEREKTIHPETRSSLIKEITALALLHENGSVLRFGLVKASHQPEADLSFFN